MNRGEFLGNQHVQGFLRYFGTCLPEWHVEYDSRYRKIPACSRHFDATGVEEALQQYCWPAPFVAPADALGFNAGEHVRTMNWESTQAALQYLSQGLRSSIEARDNDAVIAWATAILDWGMGIHGAAAINCLTGLRDPSCYLACVAGIANLDQAVVPPPLGQAIHQILYVNAGLSKIHSLASADGLVIFDSRVAHSLTQCINSYLNQNGIEFIPPALELMRTSDRTPQPVGRHGRNHPIFTYDHRWLDAQIRASWLIHAVLEQNPDIFAGEPIPLRAHRLEAALFMMGAPRNRGQAPAIPLPAIG